MKEQLSSGLVAVACVALLAHGAMGSSVFFSTIGEVGQGVHPDNPHLHIPPGSTATVYIWATDDQGYDTTIGMNVVSSSPTYAALQGGEVLNPKPSRRPLAFRAAPAGHGPGQQRGGDRRGDYRAVAAGPLPRSPDHGGTTRLDRLVVQTSASSCAVA